MKLFFDVNVILDVLTSREPWVAESAATLSLLDGDDVQGFIAAHTVTTLHYLTGRHLDRQRANAAMLDLLNMFRIVPVEKNTLLQALSITAPDFEDAVQAVCAMNIGADYLITRNARDFHSLGLQALSPAEFLALFRSSAE
ncbi:MAG: PIN domain-containing protein [Longimicrobiales bacterium]